MIELIAPYGTEDNHNIYSHGPERREIWAKWETKDTITFLRI